MSVTLRALEVGVPLTGGGFAGDAYAVADGDGRIHVCALDGAVAARKLHEGAILAVATDAKSGAIVTAGDDGRAIRIRPDGEPETLHAGRKWVDTVACSPRGAVAWSAGKAVFLLARGADAPAEATAPSSVGDLAFSPDGKWLGAAVYGGAFLVRPSRPSETVMLNWQGAHNAIGFSPDGRFCVTAMLENALHVWRLDRPEEKHGRMGGYPAKPVSFDWTADGRYLATAGAEALVLWPFLGADGPIGQQAGVFAPEQSLLSRTVAARPRSQQIAIGHVDGSVTLFDRKSQRFMPVAAEHEAGQVNSLSFSPDGRWLGFTRERGVAGLADLGKP